MSEVRPCLQKRVGNGTRAACQQAEAERLELMHPQWTPLCLRFPGSSQCCCCPLGLGDTEQPLITGWCAQTHTAAHAHVHTTPRPITDSASFIFSDSALNRRRSLELGACGDGDWPDQMSVLWEVWGHWGETACLTVHLFIFNPLSFISHQWDFLLE